MPERQQIRLGRISSINYEKGTARVTYEDKGGSTTAELPFSSREYRMPQIGDQVMTAHFTNGGVSGMILGTAWHNNNRPAEGRPGLYRRAYGADPEKAYEKYDDGQEEYVQKLTGKVQQESTETWQLKVGETILLLSKDGSVQIIAPTGITINAPTAHFTGSIQADGGVQG